MAWTSKFKITLALKDGRTIETLADARTVILSLPDHQQRRPYWEYAAQLLMDAAQGGKREAIEQAYWQLMRALKVDRMMV
jgi:hypothetical protein